MFLLIQDLRNYQLSSDIHEGGRVAFFLPNKSLFQLYQVQPKRNKSTDSNIDSNNNYHSDNDNSSSNSSNSIQNTQNYSSLELIGSFACHSTEGSILWRYLHGNVVIYDTHNRSLSVGTFQSLNDSDKAIDQQSPPLSSCVELATNIQLEFMYVTRDRIICSVDNNEPPLMFDFTGIHHYEEGNNNNNYNNNNNQ